MCLETFDIEKKKIHCQKCDQASCIACFRSYILHCRNDPPCPNNACDNWFAISFLRSIIPQNFWNKEYIQSRKDVLFNFEEVYKNRTMIEVQRYTETKKIQNQIDEVVKLLNIQQSEVLRTKARLQGLCDDKYFIGNAFTNTNNTHIKTRVPCHANGCLGFCLQSICVVCDRQTCDKCHKELTDDHECNKDEILTIQEITKNSRPCPTCNEAISKTDGCDQMLCISCETAFSWKTGVIETGRVHNPHFYQIRARVGRELGDELCGGLPVWAQLQKNLGFTRNQTDNYRIVSKFEKFLLTFHRFANHLRAVLFPTFENLTLNFQTNLRSRVLFYTNEITREKYTQELCKAEKKRTKNIEMRDLFQTFVMVTEEIFRKIHASGDLEYIKELRGVLSYLGENYEVINKKYKSSFKIENFTSFWDFDILTQQMHGTNIT
tara:strand:+ start:8497 stop:9801 length:1305 start_codon:yes stop_codon:yes gene_type:complete